MNAVVCGINLCYILVPIQINMKYRNLFIFIMSYILLVFIIHVKNIYKKLTHLI